MTMGTGTGAPTLSTASYGYTNGGNPAVNVPAPLQGKLSGVVSLPSTSSNNSWVRIARSDGALQFDGDFTIQLFVLTNSGAGSDNSGYRTILELGDISLTGPDSILVRPTTTAVNAHILYYYYSAGGGQIFANETAGIGTTFPYGNWPGQRSMRPLAGCLCPARGCL